MVQSHAMEHVSHMCLPSHSNQKQNSLSLSWTAPAHSKHTHNSRAQLGLLVSVLCSLFPRLSLMSYFLLGVGGARMTLMPARLTFSTTTTTTTTLPQSLKLCREEKRGRPWGEEEGEVCAPNILIQWILKPIRLIWTWRLAWSPWTSEPLYFTPFSFNYPLFLVSKLHLRTLQTLQPPNIFYLLPKQTTLTMNMLIFLKVVSCAYLSCSRL